jgi:hypothetical protein
MTLNGIECHICYIEVPFNKNVDIKFIANDEFLAKPNNIARWTLNTNQSINQSTK